MAWKHPANVRRKEIMAAARARGVEAGPAKCTIPNCGCVGRPQVVIMLDEMFELYGPARSVPLSREDVRGYIRRAMQDVSRHEVVTLRIEKDDQRVPLSDSS